ncbi:DUF4124 domain-containing protein [Salinicola aestuarinus]|uniref:DUF4124 domain-containing protein n=1 Tax=Salinicola aestuarinus TaxID=1949082 RepID=UPI000DA1B2C4|nr:DUF4124 domain-containing protein [Salinicola aestuarinus]
MRRVGHRAHSNIVAPGIALLCLGLLAGPAVAATVYKHRAADGSVVFSDEPRAGERFALDPITVVDPAAAAAPSRSAETDGGAGPREAFEYARFAIASPSDEQTLPTGQAGNVQVQLDIEPALHQGDRVQLRVNGTLRQSALHTRVFALTGLDRGEYQLVAELVDASGRVRLATPPVTLYVQRASVNLPSNPHRSGRP